MKKYSVIFVLLCFIGQSNFAQTNHFDVYTYQTPAFFSKTELPESHQFNLKNSDSSFCRITLYKSLTDVEDSKNSLMKQWHELVVKKHKKADKKPLDILTGQNIDGWKSTLAIGNYYQQKKKVVVMLNLLNKNKKIAYVLYEMSDKICKGPIDLFSENLHLTNE